MAMTMMKKINAGVTDDLPWSDDFESLIFLELSLPGMMMESPRSYVINYHFSLSIHKFGWCFPLVVLSLAKLDLIELEIIR
mmetsp:Transcript_19769/g.30042  ORF Transcript_19769/g.30042 Transcript_19769/m.30042 type:complete len:81 (-) Transcript_19769:970-1212(-)